MEMRVAERTQELRTLNRVALVTNEALDLATIFSRALEASLDTLGVRAAAIILVAPELEGPIVVQQGLGAFEVDDLTSHARQNDIRKICAGVVTQEGRHKFACFPIRSKGASMGVLCADDSGEVPLASGKLRLLEALAAQLGGTVERAILHQDLERSFRGLQESQAAILERERRIAALEAVRAATVTLSHHINNATAGIAGGRNVVSMVLGDQVDWQVRYALEGIQESVKKITAVLRAMGDLTRITLTDFPGGLKAIDVDEAIQKTLAELQSAGLTTQGDPPQHLA